MRRFLCLLTVSLCALHGYGANMQKIYPITDPLYHHLEKLYVSQGLALPSSSSPWSGSELSLMLSRLEYGSLSPVEKQWYLSLKQELEDDGKLKGLRVGTDVTFESYLHSNPKSWFQGSDNWTLSQNPLAVISLDGTIASSFYGYVEGDIAQAEKWDEEKQSEKVTRGEGVCSTNLPLSGLDLYVPYRALLAAGGDNWSLEVGRERLSWGSGTTGNLLLGSQVRYHHLARIATYSDHLKYSFLVSAFPHPQNYYKKGVGYVAEGLSGDYEDGIKAYIAHRLETRLWGGRIGVAVTDSVMYMSKNNKFDLIDFCPAMIYHNNFKRGLTNTIFGIEFDITPFRGLNFYSQIVVDDWASSGETKPSDATSSDKAEPNAVGLIVGSTYVKPLQKGILSCNLEGAYTSPYLYLRDGDVQSKDDSYTGPTRHQELGEYGINFVVGTHSSYFKEEFMGYQYGCDAIVANLRIAYEQLDKFTLTGNLFYMAHGTHDQYTVWSQIDNVSVHDGWLPSTSHETQNQRDPLASLRDSLSHTFVAGLNGSYHLPYGCTVFGQADYVLIKNPGNISGNGIVQDVQLTVGLKWKVDDIASLFTKQVSR